MSGRNAAAVFIAVVNAKFPVGNWELDLRDGEIRLKTSVPLADEATSIKGMLTYLYKTGLALYRATYSTLWDVGLERERDPISAGTRVSAAIDRVV